MKRGILDPALLKHDPEETFDNSLDRELVAEADTKSLAYCKQYLRHIFRHVRSELWKDVPEEFIHASNWIDAAPKNAKLPVPFNLANRLPQNTEGWSGLFWEICQVLYVFLSKSIVGDDTAKRIFKDAFVDILNLAETSDGYESMVALLPAQLLDEEIIARFDKKQLLKILQQTASRRDATYLHSLSTAARLSGQQRELDKVRLKLALGKTRG